MQPEKLIAHQPECNTSMSATIGAMVMTKIIPIENQKVKGVYWDKSRSRWEVKIHGERVGRFKTFDEAVNAKSDFLSKIPDPRFSAIGSFVDKFLEFSDQDKSIIFSLIEAEVKK
jgi:hypothetical protein